MKKLIALSAIAILGGGALYAQGHKNNRGHGMMGGGYGMMQGENVAVMASHGMKEADIAKMLQLRKEMSEIMAKYNQPAAANK